MVDATHPVGRNGSSRLVRDLRDIHQRLRWNHVLTRDQYKLLEGALRDMLLAIDEGDVVSLDRSIGLKAWGGVSAIRHDALARRDEQIRQLWHGQEDWRDLPAPAASRLMAVDAARYQSNRWPRECSRDVAPNVEPAATWWKILISGQKIPRSAKQFQRILGMDIQDGV